jgi:hypothetical protein
MEKTMDDFVTWMATDGDTKVVGEGLDGGAR